MQNFLLNVIKSEDKDGTKLKSTLAVLPNSMVSKGTSLHAWPFMNYCLAVEIS